MEVLFDDEYLHMMTELAVTSFIGWMQLQATGDVMLSTFEQVISLLRWQGQQHQGLQEVYQTGYDGASWLSSVAAANQFDEIAAVLDAAAARFSVVLLQEVG